MASGIGGSSGAPSAVHVRSSTRGSSTISRTRAIAAALLSPGSRRKLTMARARPGSTLSLVPACTTVSAVVVRTIAAELGSSVSERATTGDSSQRLASAMRWPKGMRGASVTSMSRGAPSSCAGKGFACRRSSARASTPIAICDGGREEWPGSPAARSSSDR